MKQMFRVIKIGVVLVCFVAVGVMAVGTIFSGEMTVTRESEVSHSAAKVFTHLARFHEFPIWCPAVEAVSLTSGERVSVGSTFWVSGTLGNALATVSAFEAGKSYTCEFRSKSKVVGSMSVAVEADSDTSCRVRVSVTQSELRPPFGGLVRAMARGILEKELDRELANLNGILSGKEDPWGVHVIRKTK